ncbi:MAG TPA: hypothetical protein VFY65_09865, partial [Longimicrobium sp.]|nr:hypothetical protein [Longimicrobium sp.]
TDVVTVTQRVMMRPDLSVRVQAPSRVIAGKPVPLHATISELNGEVGAHADCRLLVDGTQQDAASGVWINAGGVVTCGFSHAFSPGAHQVQVEVTGVSPDDWDEANNLSAAVEVNAVAESAGFYYFASAAAVQVRYDHTWRSRWYNPSTGMRGEYGAESGITMHTEGASMHGYIDRLLFGEVSLEVSQSSGGRLIHSDAWTDFAQDGTLCTSRDMQSTAFFLCSYRSGSSVYTSFTYHHYAGTVTYHSREYAREWDDVTGDEIFYYDYNETFVDDKGPRLGFGDDYAFHVRVAAGDMVLTADSHFLLERLEVSTLDEYCYTDAEWWDGYRSERCVADREVGTHRHGYDEYYGG